ncbi:hypothetical protein RC74_13520 [Falsihalocynthiibacter arcticus]|uniref:Uncharacterized protein n=1 Tax=Falsihalocynthiibacter arcticus TaxID=1579316 RepID=A0A126V1U8_9RHOB|nr:hypothetical protein RC74_13520 [Falsihalocynthiibacter arcticus]
MLLQRLSKLYIKVREVSGGRSILVGNESSAPFFVGLRLDACSKLHFGPTLGTSIYQGIFTFIIGSGFYVARRVSGTAIVPMLLHAAWNYGALGTQASDARTSIIALLFQFITFFVATAGAIVVLKRDAQPHTQIRMGQRAINDFQITAPFFTLRSSKPIADEIVSRQLDDRHRKYRGTGLHLQSVGSVRGNRLCALLDLLGQRKSSPT